MKTLLQENIKYLLTEELLKYAKLFELVFHNQPTLLNRDDFEDYFETIRKLRSIDYLRDPCDGVYDFYDSNNTIKR